MIKKLNSSPKREPLSRLWFMSRGCKRTPEQQALYERTTVVFYDIDRKGWRSMRIDTIWDCKRARRFTE